MIKLFAVAAMAGWISNAAFACDLKIEDAWIRTAPPTASVLAGYAKLSNAADKPLRIGSIKSADFGKVEAHQTKTENGLSAMRAMEALEIPAHGVVELAPTGRHLMLLQPKRALKAGDSVNISFEDAAGCMTTAAFKVGDAPAEAGAMDHSQMDHSKMNHDAH